MTNLQSALQEQLDSINYHKGETERYKVNLGLLQSDYQATAANYANLYREHVMLEVAYQKHIEDAGALYKALHKDYLRAQAEASNYEQVIKNISRKWYEKLFNIKSK